MLSFPPLSFFSFTLHLLLSLPRTLLPALLHQLHIISSRKRAPLMIFLLFFVALFSDVSLTYMHILPLLSFSPPHHHHRLHIHKKKRYGSIKNETCLSLYCCIKRTMREKPTPSTVCASDDHDCKISDCS